MSEVICPHCKNKIHDEDALLCHFCGNSLYRVSGGGLLGMMRSPGLKWVWGALALMMLAAFVMTMF